MHKGVYTKHSHIKDKPVKSFDPSSFIYIKETEAPGKVVISKDIRGKATTTRRLYFAHMGMLLLKLHRIQVQECSPYLWVS